MTVFPIISIFIDRIASEVIEILRSFINRENGNKSNNFRIVISIVLFYSVYIDLIKSKSPFVTDSYPLHVKLGLKLIY